MNPLLTDAPSSAAALSFSGFTYSYPDRTTAALKEIDLTVERGEFVLLCGDSGSGKSTLLRAVSGLVPHHYGGSASGEASICGRDLRDVGAGELAAVCGTLLQDPESQSVMDSVRAEIAFPLENQGWAASRIAVAVEEAAASLGISDLLERRTDELSGGQLQRVALAAAITPHPAVLVLDEPTSQLDPVAADELITSIRRLCVDHGTTVLLAEHRIDRVLEHADRVLLFDRGEISVDATPHEFLDALAELPQSAHLLPPLAELFVRAELRPLPLDAREARSTLASSERSADVLTTAPSGGSGEVVLEARSLSFRYPRAEAPAVDGVSLQLMAGERAVLLGANGSGKSTLLTLLHGVREAGEGSVVRGGEVALLLQNPNDYLIHEHVADEAPAAALERFGLSQFAANDPRDLSGGERQRLALAVVMQSDPSVLLLDEPTRGMDTARKRQLAARLRDLSESGTAVLVATHDAEFAARFAERGLLMGSGRLLVDDDVRTVLGGARHFSTATARLLPDSGALTPQQGAEVLA